MQRGTRSEEASGVTEDAGNFKLYESDTGMLASRYDISVARGLYSDDRTLNLGSHVRERVRPGAYCLRV